MECLYLGFLSIYLLLICCVSFFVLRQFRFKSKMSRPHGRRYEHTNKYIQCSLCSFFVFPSSSFTALFSFPSYFCLYTPICNTIFHLHYRQAISEQMTKLDVSHFLRFCIYNTIHNSLDKIQKMAKSMSKEMSKLYMRNENGETLHINYFDSLA